MLTSFSVALLTTKGQMRQAVRFVMAGLLTASRCAAAGDCCDGKISLGIGIQRPEACGWQAQTFAHCL